MRNTHYDFAVIGGGPSGLATAVRLSKQFPDKKIAVLEKSTRLGGPCYTYTDPETSAVFELGCNDLGENAQSLLDDLGIKQEMKAVQSKIHSTLDNVKGLSAEALSFFTLVLTQLGTAEATLSENSSLNPEQAGMILAMLYMSLRTPNEIDDNVLKQIVSSDYAKPHVPVGGMSSTIEKMVEQLGKNVELHYEANCKLQDNNKGGVDIVVDGKDELIQAETVISSVHGWERYPELHPETIKKPLPVTAITFEMNDKFVYSDDDNIHTQVFLPEADDPTEWLNKHRNGELADKPAFHCFNNQLIHKKGGISAYILTPEGKDTLTEAEKEKIKSYITNEIDKKISGFKDNIKKTTLYSPADYKEKLGFSSHVMPYISMPTDSKIDYKDPNKNNLYYVGSATLAGFDQTIFEPAIESAKNLVEKVMEDKEKQQASLGSSSTAFFGRKTKEEPQNADSLYRFTTNAP